MQIIEREGHEWCGTQALSSPLADGGEHINLSHILRGLAGSVGSLNLTGMFK